MKAARQSLVWFSALIGVAVGLVEVVTWDPRDAAVRRIIAERKPGKSAGPMDDDLAPAALLQRLFPTENLIHQKGAPSIPDWLLSRLLEEAVRDDSFTERGQRFLGLHAPNHVPKSFLYAGWTRRAGARQILEEHPHREGVVPHLLQVWPRVSRDCLPDAVSLLNFLTPIGDRAALPVHLGLAVDQDPQLRELAVSGLAKLAGREKAARAALDALENDQVSTVREAVERLSYSPDQR